MAANVTEVAHLSVGNNQEKKKSLSQKNGADEHASLFAGEPMVWTGTDYSTPTAYTLQLQNQDIMEVIEALHKFKDRQLDVDALSRDNFRLPGLEKKLAHAANDIHNGRGFIVIRGLGSARLSAEDKIIVFLGVASYMGDMRGVQDSKGNMLCHITDSKLWGVVPYDQRHGIHTNTNLPFHNDMGTDILALQVQQVAKTGGGTHVVSSWKICEELMKTNPTVVETLLKPNWPIQVSAQGRRYILAPLLQYYDGKIMISLDPGRLGLHPVTRMSLEPGDAAIPELTQIQEEALNIFNIVATKNGLRINSEPGDLIFVNNWALLHARDSYTDDVSVKSSRHLVRLWLRNSELGWAIPANMKVPWDAAFGYYTEMNDKHGKEIWKAGRLVEKKYPTVPDPEYNVPKYTAGSAAFILEDIENGEDEV